MKGTGIILHNAKVASPFDNGRPISTSETGEVFFHSDFAVACVNENIVETGKSSRILKRFTDFRKINCEGRLLTPGFVDCHTHLVFAGNRANEIGLRLNGMNYKDIQRHGGGIHKTVRQTRKSNEAALQRLARNRIEAMLANGTTTVEIKSGYGLSPSAELKILRVIAALSKSLPCRIVPTYLPLHAPPDGISKKKFIHQSIALLKKLSRGGFAVFCDAFCEDGFFSVEDCRRFLSAAKRLGFKLKVHANEFGPSGGARLAAELRAVSADHLDHVNRSELAALRRAGCIAVLIPGVSYFLGRPFPDFRKFLSASVPFALSTDFNPGTSPIFSMPFIFSLAVLQMKIPPPLALTATTLNAAYALAMGRVTGSIQPGKKADMIIWDAERLEDIAYHINNPPINSVIFEGRRVV